MSYHEPPQRPLRFLRWFCTDLRLEEIEGDLFELFQEQVELSGLRRARRWYWWWVLRSLRGFALKRNNYFWSITQNFMLFSHHLRIAGRSLRRNPRTTAINVVGLAIGISAFLAISQILWVEYSYNRNIPDGDRIYRVTSSFTGAFSAENPGVPRPATEYAKAQFTGLEVVSVFFTESLDVKRPAEADFSTFDPLEDQTRAIWADSTYFELIQDYQWLAGNPSTALQQPYQVVLTQDQALAYFGDRPAISLLNETLLYSDSLAFTVTGVVQEPDYRSDFQFTEFLSSATLYKITQYASQFEEDHWAATSSNSQLWVKLHPDYSLAAFTEQLDALYTTAVEITQDPDFIQHFVAQPLADLHFSEKLDIFDSSRSTADRESLLIMSGVALALLLIAIFNFVNLETARSVTKSKEVGVRKVLGGHRSNLLGRFLTDSVLVTLLAVVLSIPLAHLGLNYFEDYLPEAITPAYHAWQFWTFLLGLTLIVGILSGAYPTWVVASFQPIRALKNRYNTAGSSGGSARLRRLLIGSQFAFSQLLIVGTLAIVYQLNFLLTKDLGIEDEGIVHITTPWRGDPQDHERFVTALRKESSIMAISEQRNPLITLGWSTNILDYQQGEEQLEIEVNANGGDTTFLSFYELPLLAGRNYLPTEDTEEIVINETLAIALGFSNVADALGVTFHANENFYRTVVGVIPDIHFQSLHKPIEPIMFSYDANGRSVGMRIPLGDDMQSTLNTIKTHWTTIYPTQPFSPRFMDKTVARFYQNERQISTLASIATIIAILISTLGLFGLISFSVVQRSKEMGIRKVLGASILNIGRLLSREFLLLMAISFAVATPIAYYLISQWMQSFAYQASIGWWLYVLGGLLSVLVALVAIGLKVWRASSANPIDSLRYE